MQNLFPPEIINHTTESHFAKRSTKSKLIYLTVVIAIIIIAILLPFVSLDITTQARGFVRTPFENNQLQTMVYGDVREVYIKENTLVKVGDTLIVLNTDKLEEQISISKTKLEENVLFIRDIQFVLSGKSNSIATSKYIAEYNYYLSSLQEQKPILTFSIKNKTVAKPKDN